MHPDSFNSTVTVRCSDSFVPIDTFDQHGSFGRPGTSGSGGSFSISDTFFPVWFIQTM